MRLSLPSSVRPASLACQSGKILAVSENFLPPALLTQQRVRMKYYWRFLPLASCAPHAGPCPTSAAPAGRAPPPAGAPPTDASLLSPRNVAVAAAGTLYIAEFEAHRIRKLTPDGKLSTAAGTGVAGSSGDGNRAPAAQINYPAGMAFDRAGGLYFADSGNNVVRKLYADGTIGTVLGRNPATTLYSPLAVAMDAAGTLYVGDSTFVVRAYTTAGKWIGYAGTGVPSFSGDGGPAASAALSSVNDLVADLNGNLLIADAVRLRRVDPLGIIVTVAGDGYVHSVGDRVPATSSLR